MELFREAGFHPLEIFQSASLKAAEVLDMDDQIGTIEVGKQADMVLVDANPLTSKCYMAQGQFTSTKRMK